MTDAEPIQPPPDPFRLEHLKRGEYDNRQREVRDVLISTDDFKIYSTDYGVSVCFSDTDPAPQKCTYFSIAGIGEINLLIHRLYGRRPISTSGDYEPGMVLYERQLARGIAQALLGQKKPAEESLCFLRDQLADRIRNRSRVLLFVVNLLVAFAVNALASLLAIAAPTLLADPEIAREASLAAAMGAVGALFSTTVRLQGLEIDPTARPYVHGLYGAQRVIVGVIGALVLYVGFKSGLLGGLLQPIGTGGSQVPAAPSTATFNPFWLAFVSVIAGFSERLVPGLLTSHANGAMPRGAMEPDVPATQGRKTAEPERDGHQVGDKQKPVQIGSASARP